MGDKDAREDEWEELIRSDLLPYNVSVPMHSIKHSNRFIGGPKYRRILLYVKERISRYYENFADHRIVGDHVLRIFLGSPERLDAFLVDWKEDFSSFNALIGRLRRTDIPALDDAAIAAAIRELYVRSIEWHGTAYNVDAIDTVLNPLIQGLIDELYPGKKRSERSAIYNALTFPEVLSYANRMQLDKLKLLLRALDRGVDACADEIAAFVEEYYWVDFQWGESKEYTKEDFLTELGKTTPERAKEELSRTERRIEESRERKRQARDAIAARKPIIRRYIRIFDEYAVLHDWRKEGQVKASCYLRALFREVAKRQGIEEEILWFAWPEEVVAALEQGRPIDAALLGRRSAEWFCAYTDDGAYEECFGPEALRRRDEALGLSEKDFQKELKGIGASEGRITGTARVCLSPNEANERIREGDILVTGMTMPDFVPAMQRAAAIVTDEGGITCHAAIVSRELGKPCVIGTQLASRVLKDGELVEVDADAGLIKRLG